MLHYRYIKNKKQIYVCFLLAVIFNSNIASAMDNASVTQIGRYTSVDNKPEKSQVDLLSQIIQVRFPQNIQTVGEAISYLLRLSGYSLIPASHMSNQLKIMLSKPLPAIDRNFGPMSLKDGLTTLAGPAFYLVQDPLNRMVNFRVKAQYAQLYINSSSSDNA